MNRTTRFIAAVAVVSVAIGAAFYAGSIWAPSKSTLNDGQTQQVRTLIRTHLVENPEILTEIFAVLRSRELAKQSQNNLVTFRDDLYSDANSFVGGNPEGDVTVIEFFDYRCGFCKRVHNDLIALRRDDDGIRFIYKEFPILSKESRFAARAAMAARKQGKYLAFHNALMEAASNEVTPDNIFRIADQVGIDTARLFQDMEDPRIEMAIQKNIELANALNINGTPTFIIGDNVIVGARELVQLKDFVEQARTNCVAC